MRILKVIERLSQPPGTLDENTPEEDTEVDEGFLFDVIGICSCESGPPTLHYVLQHPARACNECPQQFCAIVVFYILLFNAFLVYHPIQSPSESE